MILRSPILCVCALLLMGCSEATPDVAAQGGDPVDCALDGTDTFSPDCYRLSSEQTVVIQHPDGGFRTFGHGDTASGLVSRDGAEEADETVDGAKIIVAVGDDRYRFDRSTPGG